MKGVEVEELWGLDDEIIEQLEPMHALIFLFKWVGGTDRVVDGTPAPDAPIFFAKQTITNACATLALLNAVCLSIVCIRHTFYVDSSFAQQ